MTENGSREQQRYRGGVTLFLARTIKRLSGSSSESIGLVELTRVTGLTS